MNKIILLMFFVMGILFLNSQHLIAQKCNIKGPCNKECRCNNNNAVRKNEAYSKFTAETKELRQEIIATRIKMQGLMKDDHPDYAKVGQLAGHLFELRDKLHSKKIEYGLKDSCNQCEKGCKKDGNNGKKEGKICNCSKCYCQK